MRFCQAAAVTPPPVQEAQLCSFVAFLANENLRLHSIKTYLSVVRHLQIRCGFADRFGPTIQVPCLEYVLRGIKRREAKKREGGRHQLPITPHILSHLWEVWAPEGYAPDTILIWAAATLCFFAFLQAGEMTTPSTSSCDPNFHLCLADIAVDNLNSPLIMQIAIKQSKADPLRQRSLPGSQADWYQIVPSGDCVGFHCRKRVEAGPTVYAPRRYLPVVSALCGLGLGCFTESRYQ